VKRDEGASNGTGATEVNGLTRSHLHGTYQRATDSRKRPIRGLWIRNGKYYARLTVQDPATGRKQVSRVRLKQEVEGANGEMKLEDVMSLAVAQQVFQKLRTQRDDKTLPVLKQTPKFSEYVERYLEFHKQVKDGKRPDTLETERSHLNAWVAHLGDTRLDQINRSKINGFIAKRQSDGVSGRTVNLAVTVLRNVLNHAIDENWLKSLPTENLRPLKWTPKKRLLVSAEEIERVCGAAFAPAYLQGRLIKQNEAGKPLKNAQQFADYLRLMAYCGSRMSETLRLKWTDVDWKNQQLTVGSDGLAKNHKSRVVDFNPKLQAHLKEMEKRRPPDTDWLFPSPQRGDHDAASKTFRESLLLAREKAKMPKFGFHDCRHYFISMCVMSGIDYMTIARWVGHQDGGVLIGKVYGHLSNEHAKRQAQRINFEAAAGKSPES
jgi:integrase